jgi:hypothetical protein
MRLLLDECVPRPLKRDLVGHEVLHVVDMGWSSKRNVELLTLMVVSASTDQRAIGPRSDHQPRLRHRALSNAETPDWAVRTIEVSGG